MFITVTLRNQTMNTNNMKLKIILFNVERLKNFAYYCSMHGNCRFIHTSFRVNFPRVKRFKNIALDKLPAKLSGTENQLINYFKHSNTCSSIIAQKIFEDQLPPKVKDSNKYSVDIETLASLATLNFSVDRITELAIERVREQDQWGDKEKSTRLFEMFSGPDPSLPISTVPCTGCGALLHCRDPGIPGYMPSQRFKLATSEKLQGSICQRCYMLTVHNLALDVTVSPNDYLEVLKPLRHIKALIVAVVDMTDLPNSIYRLLPQLIGWYRPLYVIGNKVDLLPPDREGYLARLEKILVETCTNLGLTTKNHAEHTCLVSAKTGYGIEELVTKLMTDWGKKGDVYILGCTNVGKSTLFNSLLSSDYCDNRARDFIHRATTSQWPGTTLNLLKFPILEPVPWRLKKRQNRLLKVRSSKAEELRLLKKINADKGEMQYGTLMGHVGYTFSGSREIAAQKLTAKQVLGSPVYVYGDDGPTDAAVVTEEKLAEMMEKHRYKEKSFKKSFWCYDTPGVVNPDQIINRLTSAELALALSSEMIQPRTVFFKPNLVFFLSGLARIEFVEGDAPVLLTVFASSKLPIRMVQRKDADGFYKHHIGTSKLGIPLGDQERLDKIPALVGQEFSFSGYLNWPQSAGDIVLSSLGWVSVATTPKNPVRLRAYTPGGLGCVMRHTPLLPVAVEHRGDRVKGSLSFKRTVQEKIMAATES